MPSSGESGASGGAVPRRTAPISGSGSCLWDIGLSRDGRVVGFRDQRNTASTNPNDRGEGAWRGGDHLRLDRQHRRELRRLRRSRRDARRRDRARGQDRDRQAFWLVWLGWLGPTRIEPSGTHSLGEVLDRSSVMRAANVPQMNPPDRSGRRGAVCLSLPGAGDPAGQSLTNCPQNLRPSSRQAP